MTIRRARGTDAQALSGLLDELGYPGTERFIGDRLSRMLDDPDGEIAVCERDGGVIGFISFHFIPQIALEGDFARISYLCVAAAARGTGAGKALVGYCENRAGERGCDRIELHCNAGRTGAHEFYRKAGFSESPKYFVKPV